MLEPHLPQMCLESDILQFPQLSETFIQEPVILLAVKITAVDTAANIFVNVFFFIVL